MKVPAKLADAVGPLERLPEEWEAVCRGWGEPAYRGRQIFEWIHQRGVLSPAEMTNLPNRLRAKLEADGLEPVLEIEQVLPSRDGTRKLLLRTDDRREIETVLIPQLDDEGQPGPSITQCISSQVGCAMGCVFCASGVAGLKRHLTASEIVSQVLLGRQAAEPDERIRNVVLMGMGEPLHNYDAVARALVLLTHGRGLALSRRRITLSTSGLVPQIDRLGEDFGGHIQLAISLHSVRDEQRSALMPINRKHSLEALVACLRRYPLPRRDRITIEYTLMDGVNDRDSDADALVELLSGIPIKVNLIPMNSIEGSDLRAPNGSRVKRFQDRLIRRHISTFVRKQRGDDIAAACGQLAFRGEGRRVKTHLPLVGSQGPAGTQP